MEEKKLDLPNLKDKKEESEKRERFSLKKNESERDKERYEGDPRDVAILIEEGDQNSNSVQVEDLISKRSNLITSESRLIHKILVEDSERKKGSESRRVSFRIYLPSERRKSKLEKEIELLKKNKKLKEKLKEENNVNFDNYLWEIFCDEEEKRDLGSDEEWTYSYINDDDEKENESVVIEEVG